MFRIRRMTIWTNALKSDRRKRKASALHCECSLFDTNHTRNVCMCERNCHTATLIVCACAYMLWNYRTTKNSKTTNKTTIEENTNKNTLKSCTDTNKFIYTWDRINKPERDKKKTTHTTITFTNRLKIETCSCHAMINNKNNMNRTSIIHTCIHNRSLTHWLGKRKKERKKNSNATHSLS